MYRITRADVSRNKLFLLHMIEHIAYRPESVYQVFMGANGSGKSTLLQLLTGYDPDANDFHAGGSLSLQLDAGGTRYEVGYEVQKSTRYSFKVEESAGEWTELNPGGTREVYRSLWQSELNVSADTVALLNRKYRLTNMRPAERQELFSTITGVDISYGFEVWDKLKRKVSSVKGAIKENHAEMQTLISHRVDDDEVGVLQARAAEYRRKAQEALMFYRSDLGELDAARAARIMADYELCERQLRDLVRRKPAELPTPAPSMENYGEQVSEARLVCGNASAKARTILQSYEDLEELHSKLQREASRGHTEFAQEQATLEREIDELQQQLYYQPNVDYGDVEAVESTLREILPGWQERVAAFRGGRSITKAVVRRDELHVKLSEVNRGMNTVEGAIAAQESHLKHLQEPHSDHCIKCGYSATAERTAVAVATAQEKVTAYQERLYKGRKLHAELTAEHEELCQYISEMDAIISVTTRYPHLRPFFDTLFTATSLFDNPAQLVHDSSMMWFDVQAKVHIRAARVRLAAIGKITSQLAEQSVGTLEGLGERVGLLRSQYEEAFAEERVRTAIYQELSRAYTVANGYTSELSKALETFGKCYDDVAWVFSMMMNEIARLYYAEMTTQAVTIETQLGERNLLEARISGMEEHIAKLEALHSRLKVLMTAMSPQHGLLAHCAVKPVEQFIDQMNYIIGRIWSHELRVLPYRPGRDIRMDYIFPMVVAGRDSLVPDISEGSDGQLEIVNFAFMITGLLCKGNKGMPLLLDEIDRPLQPEHKEALMAFLVEMVESGWFSQIFVVSHHASAYTALPTPDMIELSPQPANPAHNRVVEFL